jgi:hypothetical protein
VRAAIEQRDVPVASARERMRAFSWEESARQLWRIAQRVLTADPATLEFG